MTTRRIRTRRGPRGLQGHDDVMRPVMEEPRREHDRGDEHGDSGEHTAVHRASVPVKPSREMRYFRPSGSL